MVVASYTYTELLTNVFWQIWIMQKPHDISYHLFLANGACTTAQPVYAVFGNEVQKKK